MTLALIVLSQQTFLAVAVWRSLMGSVKSTIQSRRVGIVGTLFVISALSSACGASETPAELASIRFTYDLKCGADWPPAMWAEDQGYFSEEGVSVEYVAGGGSSDVLPLIAAGEQDLGQVSAPPFLLGTVQDLPVTVVAVPATVSPVAIFADGSIKNPKDLEGRTVGVQVGEFEGAVWEVWANAAGIDRSKVDEVPAAGESNALFIDHRIDAFATFYGGAALELTDGREGDETIFFVQDILPMYGHTIVANNQFLQDNPEAVRGFLRAWARGMKYTIDHPTESIDVVLERCPENERAGLELSMESYLRYWTQSQAQSGGLLSFTPEGLQSTKQVLVDGGLMEDRDISGFYTTEYIPDPPVMP